MLKYVSLFMLLFVFIYVCINTFKYERLGAFCLVSDLCSYLFALNGFISH